MGGRPARPFFLSPAIPLAVVAPSASLVTLLFSRVETSKTSYVPLSVAKPPTPLPVQWQILFSFNPSGVNEKQRAAAMTKTPSTSDSHFWGRKGGEMAPSLVAVGRNASKSSLSRFLPVTSMWASMRRRHRESVPALSPVKV